MLLRGTLVLLALVFLSLVSGTQVTQLGSSGKFRISNGDGENDANAVTVEIDYVEEIVSSGSTKHKTPTMANQDFSLSSPVSTTIGNGVAASQITFTTTLTEQGGSATYGTLTSDVYIMEAGGTISTDTETFDVAEGDVKFNLALSSWTFDTNSEYVDVAVIIKGKNDEVTQVDDNTWNVGEVPVHLSRRVVVDGQETDMPNGYPSVNQSGNKYTFIFRFPKFTSSATYDPVVSYSCFGCGGSAAALLMQGVSRVGTFLRGAFLEGPWN